MALFAVVSMLYMVIVGFWTESMHTLALVAISVPLSVAIGFLLGAMAYRWQLAERIILPVLDFLQTVPAFAYLIPVIKLFGFGPVTGFITSLLYAFPAMVRNTLLGLRQVSPEVMKSGRMSGATPRQLFWLVQVPAAKREILLGINQTTMAALEHGDHCLDHRRVGGYRLGGALHHAQGVVRRSLPRRHRHRPHCHGTGPDHGGSCQSRPRFAWLQRAIGRQEPPPLPGAGVGRGLCHPRPVHAGSGRMAPGLALFPAKPIDGAISAFVVAFKGWIELVKKGAFYYVMMPVRLGLEGTVKPATWS